MKHLFIISILVVFSFSSTYAQKNNFAFSIDMGTDFGSAFTVIGLESGFYKEDLSQGLFITLDANTLTNKSIYAYGRNIVADNNIYPTHQSHEIGLKYNVRLFKIDDAHVVGLMANPTYSMNLSIPSVNAGLFTSYVNKKSMISVQFSYDPIGKRTIFKFIFTALKNQI